MRVYADHAATTPLDPRVFDAMIPFLSELFHNPSSLYAGGRTVRQAIEETRASIASYLTCSPDELYFTSGGTEAANLAILGVSRFVGRTGAIVVGATEHHAVGMASEALSRDGRTVLTVPCDRFGYISPEVLEKYVTDDTSLVSIMWANNETGVIQPVSELCEVAHRHGALFHTDAVQALGSQRINLDEVKTDLLSISSHKVYGPKGCGALFVREGVHIEPVFHGGSQEKKIRAGTENPAAIIGFGKAVELLALELEMRVNTLESVAQQFVDGIAGIPDLLCNSPRDSVIPGLTNLSIAGVESEPLLILLGAAGIDASMGAACNTQTVEPSYVLRAMNVPETHIHGSVRFSFGKDSTLEDADRSAEALSNVVSRLRNRG